MTAAIQAGVLAWAMTFASGTLRADVLHLADGSRIVGTLEQIDEAAATLSGTFAGALNVPRSTITCIETETPVFVEIDEGEYVAGRMDSASAGQVNILAEGERPLTVALADVDGIHRVDPLTRQQRARALELNATINVGVNLTNGNSETENLHADGQIVARNMGNRYTVSGEYTQEESRNVLVKRNWASLFKYDHFVADKLFWFNSANFESDEFADLELRTKIAAGFGYQVFDTEFTSLSLEAGPSYVYENFQLADNEVYVGSRWALRLDQKLWWDLTYFLYNEGVIGFQDTSDLSTSTRTGVRLDMTDRIVARLQTAIDWDRSPPEGAKGTDFEHTLTVGYTF